jgi:hypothetical protein
MIWMIDDDFDFSVVRLNRSVLASMPPPILYNSYYIGLFCGIQSKIIFKTVYNRRISVKINHLAFNGFWNKSLYEYPLGAARRWVLPQTEAKGEANTWIVWASLTTKGCGKRQ